MMFVIALLVPFLIIVFLIAAGMYEGFSAWALDEAERRTERLYKQYVEETKFVIEQTVRVEFVDDTMSSGSTELEPIPDIEPIYRPTS